jgi:hypothetical protein
VEALARQGDKYTDRILDLLARKVEDFETDPMTWLEIFLVMLAGEMRLERAIPLVVKKLPREAAPMSTLEFFRLVQNALHALASPFDARELYAYYEGMLALFDQEPTPAAWAEAFLREQRPVEVKAEAA